MLTTFGRLLGTAKVTRTGSVTYDNRSLDELVKQLQATVDVLTRRIKEMESERPTEGRYASDKETK